MACDDGGACTLDWCAAGKCKTIPLTGGTCDDGKLCTTNDACKAGGCVGTPVSCEDGNPCMLDSCNSGTGACLHIAITGGACDDQNPCTGSDACKAGGCVGAPVLCDDQSPCTFDACELGACTYTPTGAACDDGDLCTLDDGCFTATCQGAPVVCPSGTECALGVCVPVAPEPGPEPGPEPSPEPTPEAEPAIAEPGPAAEPEPEPSAPEAEAVGELEPRVPLADVNVAPAVPGADVSRFGCSPAKTPGHRPWILVLLGIALGALTRRVWPRRRKETGPGHLGVG
jgi:MYXO-CTERM domain-containing protein